MTDLSKPVQQHLVKVYTTLAALCGLLAVGAYLHVSGWFLFGGGIFSFLIGLGSFIGIMALPDTTDNRSVRYGLLFNFAIMEGLSIGPLIDYALRLNNSGQLVINACILTSLIFISFTMSALLSGKRTFLYLGGILGSAISLLIWSSLFNAFFGSKLLYSVELYIGLFIFCGYVLYDTQLILYRASQYGSRDVVAHALDLFVDLVGIFVRILITLTKNAEERDDRRRRKAR
ncbi:hypothetical protein G9A89_016121 [Geosiphon pyriformis]|nr:hypothetical protein G9A89_016121 [Geosiphon pyriformis]